MKQRKHLLSIYIMVICMLISYVPVQKAKAASATVTISLKDNDIKLHDNFTVVVKVEADEPIGGFEAFLSYDDKRMKFKHNSDTVSGDAGIIRISDLDPENLVTSRQYILQFKAIDQGNALIETMDQAYVYTYEDSAEMSVSCNKLSVNIGTDKKASKNNNLYSLRISPGTLTPSFDKKTTNYSTEVESDVDKVIVSAIAVDSGANVKTSGTDNLKPGMNTVNITVTAPSGDKKDYTISILKKSADGEEESVDEEEKIDEVKKEEEQKQLMQDGYLIKEENKTITLEFGATYTIVPLEDDELIPKGYEASTMLINQIQVPVYEKTNKEPSDYLLLYLKGRDGVPRFYRYDKVENTVQRYEASYDDSQTSNANAMTEDEYSKKLNSMKILVAISCAITLIATLLVVRLLIKNRGIKEDDF